jgi:OOP family OmpA-OmpF porin
LFGEILAPAIGTAVRRAVTDALAALMQRINQLLERGLSLRSFAWRLEARRTGRPFAEIVVARTLVYRVEWAVLIHTPTSLVLEQATTPEGQARAPDQTSAMLQAINSFVSDALGPASPGAALQAIEVGDLSLWIERDPAFTIAVAIRGVAPVALRDDLRRTLERVRTLHHDPEPQPDITTYGDTHPLLVDCLEQQQRTPPKRAQWVLAVAGLGVLLAVGLLVGHGANRHRDDTNFRAAYRTVLSSTPGLVVTSVERAGGGYLIRGLHDPRAAPPAFIIAAAGLPAAALDLAPFQSLDPRLEDAMAAAATAIRALEEIEVEFAPGASSLEASDAMIARAAELVERAERTAAQAHAGLCVEILGDSDDSGSDQRNLLVRAARASSVARALQRAGVDGALLAPRAGDPLRAPPHARRVTFRAALRPDPRRRGCP